MSDPSDNSRPGPSWFDGHLDLAYVADHGRDLTGQCSPGPSDLAGNLTFPALRAARVRAAISTLFVRRRTPGVDGPYCFDTPDQAHAAAVRQIEMHRAWQRDGWIEPLQTARPGGGGEEKLQTVLALEGAACVRSPDDLAFFHAAGVRVIALAWAEGSPWSGGDQAGGDVTPAGLDLLNQIDQLECVHDVTHLGERAFWTVLARARGKIIASHSNCRALLAGAKSPERHLSDDQIRALAQRGGIIGVNLFARFLLPHDELKSRRATSADVVRHIEHIAAVAGSRDCIALGSDFDSGFGPDLLPADIQGPADLPQLAAALARAGWSNIQIARFANRWSDFLE